MDTKNILSYMAQGHIGKDISFGLYRYQREKERVYKPTERQNLRTFSLLYFLKNSLFHNAKVGITS